MKKAIIIGCNGQDGTLLYDFLLNKNYNLVGIAKNSIKSNYLKINPVDITNKQEVFDIVKMIKPDEIYHLAAFHHSSEDTLPDTFELFQKSFEINVWSLINFLEAIKRFSQKTRLFYASSSQIFGNADTEPQNEETPINPTSIYGITKGLGMFISRFYRKDYELFVSAGILYNHESKYRKPNFISQKIISGAIDIKNKNTKKIKIGDLNSEVDWGYAPDYIKAFYKILNIETPDDFIIATGEKHTVLDFVKIVFGCFGLNWQEHIETDKKIINEKNDKRAVLVGNPEKIKKMTDWKPSISFEQMVNLLIAEKSHSGKKDE